MNRRFLPLAAAVLVPVLVLALFAWRGVQAQRRAAWADKHEVAQIETTAKAQVLGLYGGLKKGARALEFYPDPPLPRISDEGSRRLDAAKTVDDLRALRDDPGAGQATSGLPIRVLAATRLVDEDAAPVDVDALIRLVIRTAPSILTRPILDDLKKRHLFEIVPGGFPGDAWEDEWNLLEQGRLLALQHPGLERGWLAGPGGTWWIDRKAAKIIPPGVLSDAIRERDPSSSPRWSGFRLRVSNLMEYPDEPFVAAPVPEYPGMILEMVVTDPELVNAGAYQQERWTLAMVGTSFLTALTGLLLIHRAYTRERRLNELKSHFVASVSHELRAPVGSIRLMADALDEGKVSPETAANFHRLISREGKRLSHLIENVLDFARIEQGRKRWHFEAADLASLAGDTVKLMGPLAAEKRIALAIDVTAFHAEPIVDSAAIQQALVNLLDNAIKFSPPDTLIETTLSSDDHHWRLGVLDHGPGIPAAEHTKIFERFYRPGNELRRETHGTGIGLSLVKAIAEAHGGKVDLESRAGAGSTFALVIPLAPATGASRSAGVPPVSASPPSQILPSNGRDARAP